MPGPDHPLVQAADWAVTLVLLAAAVTVRRWSRSTSILTALVALSWVVGGLFGPAALWHRAVLVHLVLALPGWRPAMPPAAVVVLGTYAVCVAAPALLQVELANVVHSVAVVAAALHQLRGSTGRTRHDRRTALVAAALLLAAVAAGGVLRGWSVEESGTLALLAYEAAVVTIVLLTVSRQRPPPASTLTDLVIDLGETRSGTLRDALARTLCDPDLRLGFWDPGRGRYVDEDGRPVRGTGPRRTAVPVGPDQRPFALLDVDSALASDPRVVASIRAAAEIIAVNASRQQELVQQARELEESRRRLITVSDEERRRFERRLRAGVVRRLEALADDLRALGPRHGSGHLRRAVEHLQGTMEDLTEVAAGLRPRELAGGLTAAVTALAVRVPCECTVDAEPAVDTGLSAEVELTAWYVCAEALSNTAKHAPGARISISLSRTGADLHVRVADDGPGGARVHEGGGLVGLRDRVDSLGGVLRLSSDGTGTVLEADLPGGCGTS